MFKEGWNGRLTTRYTRATQTPWCRAVHLARSPISWWGNEPQPIVDTIVRDRRGTFKPLRVDPNRHGVLINPCLIDPQISSWAQFTARTIWEIERAGYF